VRNAAAASPLAVLGPAVVGVATRLGAVADREQPAGGGRLDDLLGVAGQVAAWESDAGGRCTPTGIASPDGTSTGPRRGRGIARFDTDPRTVTKEMPTRASTVASAYFAAPSRLQELVVTEGRDRPALAFGDAETLV
jgi:hypothetical protein